MLLPIISNAIHNQIDHQDKHQNNHKMIYQNNHQHKYTTDQQNHKPRNKIIEPEVLPSLEELVACNPHKNHNYKTQKMFKLLDPPSF